MESKIFIFEFSNGQHRGIVATTEGEAREIATASGRLIVRLVLVEKLLEKRGMENG